jgi:anti-anti-sigma factor
MAVHALMEVEVVPGRERQVLWAGSRLARRLAERPGFRALRVYRSETCEERLLVLAEWDEWEAVTAAESDIPVAGLLIQLQRACARWEGRRLESLFHLQLPHRSPSGGMAQTLRVAAQDAEELPALQKQFGLKAMSLPGTIGVLGARCAREPEFLLCALEFDTAIAGDDFAGSATWHEWSRRGKSSLWRKEPRLELCADQRASLCQETEHRSERLGSLSVRIESTPDGATVVLRLHGCLDETAAERFVRVRDAVVACGCRDLTLDVSQLTRTTPEGLKTLVATARQIKAAGGRFSMTDHQRRYHQILRSWHLDRAVHVAEEPSPRRKVAGVRIQSSGRG